MEIRKPIADDPNGPPVALSSSAPKAKFMTRGGELIPGPRSGWRELKEKARKIYPYVTDGVRVDSFSVWYRNGVMAVSALEDAEAPDGSGDVIPTWHVSFAGKGRRSTDHDVRAACVCFGIQDAEEDNHHPGGIARHYFLPVDPARRVSCECKVTETTIVEADGYRSTTLTDGPCSGCALRRTKLAIGLHDVPQCPLHPEAP